MQIKLAIPLVSTLLFHVAFSGSLARRDATTVNNDLNTLKSDLASFSSALANFSGGLTEALAIEAQENKIESDLKKATSDTNASSAFSSSGSTTVTNTLLGLKPDILSALNLIVSKESEVASLGLTDLVHTNLVSLKSETDALSTALQSKVTSTDAATIASNTVDVDNAYDAAIAVFA